MDDIHTFEQARAVLLQQDHTVEKHSHAKLWVLDGRQSLDKGGIIAAARALAGQGASPPARVAPATPLPLASIRTDGGTQARAALDEGTVTEYVAAMQAAEAAPFPPVIVVYDGAAYWLADGFHRVAAAQRVDAMGAIAAEIRPGTRRDAVLLACGANATHGLRRSAADKRRAIETLLRDAEWQQWSDREVARRCAVDHKTVASVRQQLTSTGEIPQSPTRQAGDGRRMQVTAIAAANAARIDPLRSMDSGAAPGPPPLSDTSAPAPRHPEVHDELEPGPSTSAPSDRDPARTAPPAPAARRATAQWADTDLDATLGAQLLAAGWRWLEAKRAANGWHHVVRHFSGEQRLLLRHRLVALCPLDLPSAPTAVPASAPNTAARHRPIVPTVLYFADQTHPYRLPGPQRLAVVYGTPYTVRLADPGAQLGDAFFRKTVQQTHVWCIPNDTAWTRLTEAHAALQQALNTLADALRQRGRYDRQLAAAGGFKHAPNPLAPTVIAAHDPDAADGYSSSLGAVPQLERRPIGAHTPKMLRVRYWEDTWSISAQHHYFLCPTDTDWTEIAAAHQAVQAARGSLDQVLGALGHYSDALADSRYAVAAAAPPAEATVIGPRSDLRSRWPSLIATEALLVNALAHVRSELAHGPENTCQLLGAGIHPDALRRATRQLLTSPLFTAAVADLLMGARGEGEAAADGENGDG